MLIDLYKDPEVTRDQNRLLKQVETRAFHLNCSEMELSEVCKSDARFYRTLKSIMSKPREYSKKYECSFDSHFLAEAMGIGRDCKKYTVIVDFSDSLDYVLHRLTGCPIEKVRRLDNYQSLSKGIMTLNYDLLKNVKLGDLANIDDSIKNWLAGILNDINTESSLCDKEILDMLLLRFYRAILLETYSLKSYIMMYLRNSKELIIRSKSICGILGTTDNEIDTTCTLIESNRPEVEKYDLKLYRLRRFEFFTGGVYDVFSWLYRDR